MDWFIEALVMVLVAVVAFIIAGNANRNYKETEYDDARVARNAFRIGGAVAALVAGLLLVFSTVFTQGVGEAKVIVNLDGTIAGEKLSPGFGVKAPWQHTEDFDLFAQEVLFAGAGDNAPSYSGGAVNGAEVTASVKNGAQAFIDVSVVYSLDADSATELYSDYRSQERFTRQVIVPSILSAMRDVPSAYTPVQFRGEMRGEATEKLLEAMNNKLGKYGVEVSNVNLQDIRFTEQVEESIKSVEVAQQKEEQAQAELRATEVSAQAQIVEATAKAEANRLLTESLTPEVLQQRYIDALGKGTVFVVPEGSTPLITTK